MYVAAVDSEILRSAEMWELWEQYEKNSENVSCLSIMPTLTGLEINAQRRFILKN